MKNKNGKRIFIGIPAGCQIKSILTHIKSAVNCNPPFIKWVPTENIHLTLSFLGNISNDDIPNLIQFIGKNIARNNFQLSIAGTGVFPSTKSPKVLWLGLDKGIDKLTLLQHQVAKSISEFKDNDQENTFIPHITIAKIKQMHGKIDVLPFLDTVYSPIELEVNSIYMFESQLFPEGVKYTVLNKFPLN